LTLLRAAAAAMPPTAAARCIRPCRPPSSVGCSSQSQTWYASDVPSSDLRHPE
jgi:hypothetical protein